MIGKDYEKITLKNGLRVILAPLESVMSATAIVLCGAGSRYETKQTNGISHFLEHMYFKGTKKRPTASDISHALDAIGADYNAFTGKEETAYHIKAASKHLPLAIDMLADMLWNSKFDEAEIEKERGVIIEELNMYEDTPMRKVAELYENLLWGDQPLGWDIGGNKDIIRKITKQDFVDYIKARYTPNNIVVAISGNFKRDETLKLIEKNFGHKPYDDVSGFILGRFFLGSFIAIITIQLFFIRPLPLRFASTLNSLNRIFCTLRNCFGSIINKFAKCQNPGRNCKRYAWFVRLSFDHDLWARIWAEVVSSPVIISTMLFLSSPVEASI